MVKQLYTSCWFKYVCFFPLGWLMNIFQDHQAAIVGTVEMAYACILCWQLVRPFWARIKHCRARKAPNWKLPWKQRLIDVMYLHVNSLFSRCSIFVRVKVKAETTRLVVFCCASLGQIGAWHIPASSAERSAGMVDCIIRGAMRYEFGMKNTLGTSKWFHWLLAMMTWNSNLLWWTTAKMTGWWLLHDSGWCRWYPLSAIRGSIATSICSNSWRFTVAPCRSGQASTASWNTSATWHQVGSELVAVNDGCYWLIAATIILTLLDRTSPVFNI